MKSVLTVIALFLVLVLCGVAQAGAPNDALAYTASPALTLADLDASTGDRCNQSARILASLDVATDATTTSISSPGYCLRMLRCCDQGNAGCCANFDRFCNPPN